MSARPKATTSRERHSVAMVAKENQVRREHLTDEEYARLGRLFEMMRRIKARRLAAGKV